jgi:hypothetical protein
MKKNKRNFFSVFIRLWFAARMAMHGILANPLRSALTILGVAIGVASVVSLMGIGEGARRAVVEQFESLGSNVIAIKSQHSSAQFEPEYADQLVERVDGLKLATPVTYAKAVMKWRRIRGNVEIVGVNSRYPEIRDRAVEIILEQMDEIKKGRITDYEFEATMKTIKTGINSLKDSQLHMTDFYLGQAIAGTDDTFDTVIEKVSKVTKQDVVDAAAKIRLDTVYFLASEKSA